METVTLRKHVTKYKSMRKSLVEFLRKFKNRAIKTFRDNLIFITQIYQFSYLLEFCMVLSVRCDVDIFKLTASAQFIYREVYD